MTSQTADDLTYTTIDYRGEEVLHHILVIVYLHGKPHIVVTDHGTFDFDWFRLDEALYFKNSGGGIYAGGSYQLHRFSKPSPPPGQLWTAPGITLHEWKSNAEPKVPVSEENLLEMGYVRVKNPLLLKIPHKTHKVRNPFSAGHESDEHSEYCSICDSFMHEMCRHLYLPECGDCVGSGGDEPSQESMFAAFDWLESVKPEHWHSWCFVFRPIVANPLLLIEKMLMSDSFKRCSISPHCLDGYFGDTFDDAEERKEAWQECEDGLGWLTTLGTDTPKENAKTLAWIMCWRLSRHERAAAKSRKSAIKELQSLVTDANRGDIIAALGISGKIKAELDGVSTERIREVAESVKGAVVPMES